MAAAVAAAGPDAPVPTCPDWRVRDLVRHTGGVHRWATGYVPKPGPRSPTVDLDEVVGTWPADDDAGRLAPRGLRRPGGGAGRPRPPDLRVLDLPAARPSPLALWARRQAHETAIHRVDAELAAGRPHQPRRRQPSPPTASTSS